MSLLAHADHHMAPSSWDLYTVVPVAVVAVIAASYTAQAVRLRREPRSWSLWRTASFLTGAALLIFALVPALSPYPAADFRGHMHQHLLLGMYAPLALVLGAPMTLLLRSIPRRHGRKIGRVLRSRPAHFLAHPIVTLTLTIGGLAALYFTPLYAAAGGTPALHALIHLHFLAAGYLFAWVIAGPDPAPRRPSVHARLVLLGIAIAAHAIISQLIYAGLFTRVPVTADELRGAGSLMYYGGDIAELLLALALLANWRPKRAGASQFAAQPLSAFAPAGSASRSPGNG
jgi:putative membrane protein